MTKGAKDSPGEVPDTHSWRCAVGLDAQATAPALLQVPAPALFQPTASPLFPASPLAGIGFP